MIARLNASLFTIAFLAGFSSAEATVFFVKSGGNNASPCTTIAQPCQDLAGAVGKAGVNDSVLCLDSGPQSSGSGSFNPITITKSIDIDCHGVTELFRDISGSAAITIDIPVNNQVDPHRTVRLRGLSLFGGFFTIRLTRGIEIINAAVVNVENMVISDFAEQGIYDHRTGGQTKLFVTDSVIRNNVGAGIVAASSAVGITVLDNVRLLNNGYGVAAAGGNNVVVARSVISGNNIAGIEADGGAQVEVSNSTITHNNIGVQAFGTVRLRENDIKFSNIAIQGSTISFGANRLSGNGSLGATPSLVSGAPADLFN